MADTSDLRCSDARGQARILRATRVDGASRELSASLDGEGVERTLLHLKGHDRSHAAGLRVAVALIAKVALVLLAATAASAQPPPEDFAIEQFMAATREYAALHRLVEQSFPPLEINSDPAEINRSTRQLATVLRAERRNAKAGDLFTDDVAAVLRARIAEALAGHGYTPGDLLVAEAVDGIDPSAVFLRVNDPFAWIHATAMFPCVQRALPELPPELQYRIVGRTLVLIDVHAGLIVDLLRSAIGDTELR